MAPPPNIRKLEKIQAQIYAAKRKQTPDRDFYTLNREAGIEARQQLTTKRPANKPAAHGVTPMARGRQPKISPEAQKKAAEKYLAGASVKDLAAENGVSGPTMYGYLTGVIRPRRRAVVQHTLPEPKGVHAAGIKTIRDAWEKIRAQRGFNNPTPVVKSQLDGMVDAIFTSAGEHGSNVDPTVDALEFLDGLLTQEPLPSDYFDTARTGNLLDIAITHPLVRPFLSRLVLLKASRQGAGELAMPFVVRGWLYEARGDGRFDGSLRQIKAPTVGGGAASVGLNGPRGIGGYGKIDDLNNQLFGGIAPGQTKTHTQHADMVLSLTDPIATYVRYLTPLFPHEPAVFIKDWASALVAVVADFDKWSRCFVLHFLRLYKREEKWKSMVVLNNKNLDYANIVEINESIFNMGLVWKAVMKKGRGGEQLNDARVSVQYPSR